MILEKLKTLITKENKEAFNIIYEKDYYNMKDKLTVKEYFDERLKGYNYQLFSKISDDSLAITLINNFLFNIEIDLEDLSYSYKFTATNDNKIMLSDDVLIYQFTSQFGNKLMFEVNFASEDTYLTQMDKSFTKEESNQHVILAKYILDNQAKNKEELNDFAKLFLDVDLKKDNLMNYVFNNLFEDTKELSDSINIELRKTQQFKI